MGEDTGVARRRPTRKNARVDRYGRVAASREHAELSSRVPPEIQWTLAKQTLTRHRFTPFQWAILRARWPSCEVCGQRHIGSNSSVFVGRVLEMVGKSDQIRAAERVAEQTAYELYYVWRPIHAKWTRIKTKKAQPIYRGQKPGRIIWLPDGKPAFYEELGPRVAIGPGGELTILDEVIGVEQMTPDEKLILRRQSRGKKGRREQADPGSVVPAGKDPMDTWLGSDGKVHSGATRFTDVGPDARGGEAAEKAQKKAVEKLLDGA